jgi:hypothetical protein
MVNLPENIVLKENSWIAKLAARKMKAHSVALVLGKTIHLHNISPENFVKSPSLARHELKHVEQYKRMGFFTFLVVYLYYSLKYGYYNNPLEIEARAAEDPDFLS